MGLFDKLLSGPTKNGQSFIGERPSPFPGSLPNSEKHYNYELEKQVPDHSERDLDGKTPSKYLDNPPG